MNRHYSLRGAIMATMAMLAFGALALIVTPDSALAHGVFVKTVVTDSFVPAVDPTPGTPAVEAVYKSFGSQADAPRHNAGPNLDICQVGSTHPWAVGAQRPGGFCTAAMTPQSLSGRATGRTMVSAGVDAVPGTPGSPAIPAQCKTYYVNLGQGLHSHSGDC